MKRTDVPPILWKLVSDKLPQEPPPKDGKKPVNRRALILMIAQILMSWPKVEATIKPRAEKSKRLSSICGQLSRAAAKSHTALKKLGAVREMEKASAQRIALGGDPLNLALGGHSALLDLFLVSGTAKEQLQCWDKLYGKIRQDPRAFAPMISGQVETLLCKMGSYDKFQFEQFLQRISGQCGLPTLSAATLQKRIQRAKKKKDKAV